MRFSKRFQPHGTMAATVAAAELLAGIAAPASAANKTTAVARYTGSLPAAAATVATASLEQGKAKRMIVVSGTLLSAISTTSVESCDVIMSLRVNGIPMDNGEVYGTCECSISGCIGCSVSTTQALDIDAAENAHPGVFLNQPINVELVAESGGVCSNLLSQATVVAQMVRK